MKGAGDVCQDTLEKVELMWAEAPREGFLVESAGRAGKGGSAWKRREVEAVGGVARTELGKGSGFLHDSEKVEASRGGFFLEVGWVGKIGAVKAASVFSTNLGLLCP